MVEMEVQTEFIKMKDVSTKMEIEKEVQEEEEKINPHQGYVMEFNMKTTKSEK